ncbi:MAG: deoxyhypusine synthase family protein [Myxococcota bacterium]|jgi:deoxyhypusine synthase|nr:deoxyhypusine synthase family protein [Myxococcota bacterium]
MSDLMDPNIHHRELRDGREDGLTPLEPLDLSRIEDFDQLLRTMAGTAFGGRRLGEAAEVLEAMVTDPECSVVLTLSGAMTVAKMNLVITEMVERGWVQAIVSTGALLTHGLVELEGMEHFKADHSIDDTTLFEKGYNRVYDTYELEKNLNDLAETLGEVFDSLPTDRRFGSRELLSAIGSHLAPRGRRGILSACWRRGVPIYIPAMTDSELGLDLATWILEREGRPIEAHLEDLQSPFDPFRDLGHYTRLVSCSPRLGIFTIGGGVPRNWAQQASPFIDIVNTSLGKKLPLSRFGYGVRICPEPAHWGGLSGCTYSEGVSWGKFLPPAEGGRYAEVHADATLVWPLLVKGVIQRLERSGTSASAPVLDLDGCRPR